MRYLLCQDQVEDLEVEALAAEDHAAADLVDHTAALAADTDRGDFTVDTDQVDFTAVIDREDFTLLTTITIITDHSSSTVPDITDTVVADVSVGC